MEASPTITQIEQQEFARAFPEQAETVKLISSFLCSVNDRTNRGTLFIVNTGICFDSQMLQKTNVQFFATFNINYLQL